MTSSSDSLPSPSARPPKTAPLSVRTRFALEWMEEKRWSPLRSTAPGFAGDTAYHEMRYRALKTALLALLEAEELKPPDLPGGPVA
jgi:hypothetical protein